MAMSLTWQWSAGPGDRNVSKTTNLNNRTYQYVNRPKHVQLLPGSVYIFLTVVHSLKPQLFQVSKITAEQPCRQTLYLSNHHFKIGFSKNNIEIRYYKVKITNNKFRLGTHGCGKRHSRLLHPVSWLTVSVASLWLLTDELMRRTGTNLNHAPCTPAHGQRLFPVYFSDRLYANSWPTVDQCPVRLAGQRGGPKSIEVYPNHLLSN